MRSRLMSPPGSAGSAGAELPASCAMGSCATEGGEAGSEAVGEVAGDGELPAGALDDVLPTSSAAAACSEPMQLLPLATSGRHDTRGW